MTGNIILGLAVARGSVSLASHTAVSLVGYISGVVGATRIAYGLRSRSARRAPCGRGTSPGRCGPSLLLAGFTVGWEVSGARPGLGAKFRLLAAAAAMDCRRARPGTWA